MVRFCFKGVPSYTVPQEADLKLLELLVSSGLVQSKRQAREDIQNGAIYINGERVQDLEYQISDTDKIGNMIVLRRGKKKYFLLQF